MKILIASDIHGSAAWCKKVLALAKKENVDKILLVGDLLYHGPRNPIPPAYDPQGVVALLSSYREKIWCVRGNCDAEVDQMLLPFPIMDKTREWTVDGRTWFAAHGHRAGANPTACDLPTLPAGSVVLSGHTHIPMMETNQDGILLLNPGSVSIPKGGFEPSYAIYEDGCFSVVSLSGETLLGQALHRTHES